MFLEVQSRRPAPGDGGVEATPCGFQPDMQTGDQINSSTSSRRYSAKWKANKRRRGLLVNNSVAHINQVTLRQAGL